MVNKGEIVRNLRALRYRYSRKPRTARDPLYFSKLSLLELCGWIEVTMDSIVEDCASRHLSNSNNRTYVTRDVVNRTYGFSYDRHFRFMLIRVIGLIKVEELETNLNQSKFQAMESSLTTLSTLRNSEAHNYIAGITPTVPAPSVVQYHFNVVYDGLKDMERCLRNLRF